jgi:hypothetical protein
LTNSQAFTKTEEEQKQIYGIGASERWGKVVNEVIGNEDAKRSGVDVKGKSERREQRRVREKET